MSPKVRHLMPGQLPDFIHYTEREPCLRSGIYLAASDPGTILRLGQVSKAKEQTCTVCFICKPAQLLEIRNI